MTLNCDCDVKKSEEKPKILIIDDSEADIELSTMMLEKNGYTVVAFTAVSSCIEMINTQKPDLVLLDIMMPAISGNQLLAEIRTKWSQIELPVIMVTAKSDASDVIESLDLGANDFISKPVEFKVAIKRIAAHLLIAGQSKKAAQASELMAVSAMIVTYNHQINNPLAIAIGKLKIFHKNPENVEVFKEISQALWRISEIVKKTQEVIEKGSIEYEKYAYSANMLKLAQDDGKTS
jgi:DNA-binding response OmpR family regulator